MREEILYRVKFTVLLALFIAPVLVTLWSSHVQSQLERDANQLPPAPEFAFLQYSDEEMN